MKKARLKNLITGETIEIYATTEHPASSYGQPVWVDADGNAYGICDGPAPLGFELIEVSEKIGM